MLWLLIIGACCLFAVGIACACVIAGDDREDRL